MAKWTVGAASGVSQTMPAYAAVGRQVYAAGSGSQAGDTLQLYSVDDDAWRQRQAMPAARARGAMAGDGQALYYLGGADGSGRSCWDVYHYDPGANSWQWHGFLQRPRIEPGAVSVGGVIYVVGGMDGEDLSISYEVEAYNTATQWSTLAGVTLPNARARPCCIAVDDKIYIIGGRLLRGVDDVTPSALVEVLDTSAGTVKTLAGLPVASDTVYGYHLDGELHCLAGYQFYIYSIGENSWRYGETLPSASGPRDAMFLTGTTCVVMPYVTVNRVMLGDIRTVEIVGASPAAGFVDEQVDNLFSWELKASTPVVQKSAQFQWMEQGAVMADNIYVHGADQWVRVPAGTFPDAAAIRWRVMAATTENVESAFSEWYTLTTEDEPHAAPTGLYPAGGTRNATKDIQLSWVVNAPLGTAQTAYEVQVAYDEGLDWQAVAGGAVSGGAAMHTVPGGTLEPGADSRVFWRVRTYNTDGQAGAWSGAASFLALVAPQPPQWVGVESGRARPLCRWLAAGQAAWQVQVRRGDETVHDSGEQPGTDNGYRVADYLAPGPYTFRARVQNELHLWSDWSGYEALVSFEQPLRVALEARAVAGGALLQFEVGVK